MIIKNKNPRQPFNVVSPAILVLFLTLHLSLPALTEATNHSWKKMHFFFNLMWVFLLIGFLYHKGSECMSIKEIEKYCFNFPYYHFLMFQETKVLKLVADNFFGKQYFFSLQRVRKLLSSDRHQFLSLFVSIRMYCKGGLRFSSWALEVLVLRVRKRPLSLSTVVISSLLELALPKKKI